MDIIVVDICNTLADINSELQVHFGIQKPKGEYLFPGADEVFFSNNTWLFAKARAFPGAACALRKLAKRYEIVYLTKRSKCSDSVTKNWFKENGFPDACIMYRNDKVAAALEIGAVKAIEDAPTEIRSYKLAGIPVMVHKRDYNTSYKCRFDWKHINNLI